MLTNLIKQLFHRPPSILGEILSTEASREELLGMRSLTPPSQSQILEDASRIVNYSTKMDYRVWSKEAWAKALSYIDALQNPKATGSETDFYRGALHATLNLLRVSELARLQKEELEKSLEENVSSVR